jgi:hypothetical protein
MGGEGDRLEWDPPGSHCQEDLGLNIILWRKASCWQICRLRTLGGTRLTLGRDPTADPLGCQTAERAHWVGRQGSMWMGPGRDVMEGWGCGRLCLSVTDTWQELVSE